MVVVVVVVGAVAGGVGGLLGDVALPGGLLSWVTRMVVVGGIVAAMGASLGW